ncbi:hypothetical protein BTVI_105224 [Pitangus sulphuratus]|nr:hypothetical protein BTVI_105224 [Pitangus sulphuratus]
MFCEHDVNSKIYWHGRELEIPQDIRSWLSSSYISRKKEERTSAEVLTWGIKKSQMPTVDDMSPETGIPIRTRKFTLRKSKSEQVLEEFSGLSFSFLVNPYIVVFHSFRWTLLKRFLTTAQEPPVPPGKRLLLQQTAKPSSTLDHTDPDLGEEDADSKLVSGRGDESRVFQGDRFSSHTPSISVHCSGRGSSGLSWIPTLPDDGKIPEMLARSASYWRHQEPPECWVRDYTCLAACPPSRRRLLQHHLPGEDDSLTSLGREELFSVDEVNDGSTGDTGKASSQADVESDDGRRSFVEEYSLAPLSRPKTNSAKNFDQLVEKYFRRL